MNFDTLLSSVPKEYRGVTKFAIGAFAVWFVYRLWKKHGTLAGLPEGYNVEIKTDRIADAVSKKFGLSDVAKIALNTIIANVVKTTLFPGAEGVVDE